MNSQEILRFCLERGFLLDKEILNLFSETSDTESVKLIIERIKDYTHQRVITKHLFDENKEKVVQILSTLPKENQQGLEKLKIKLGLSIEISKEFSIEKKETASKIDRSTSDVKILSKPINFAKKLEVEDFTKYFRNRLSEIKNILQSNSSLNNLVSINKISGSRQGMSIIGIVSDKHVTKNKNILFDVEDLTGKIRVLINQNNKKVYEKAEEICLDSVIGFNGSGNREIIFANDIVFPDSVLLERKRSPAEEYALFIGDLHFGSKLFMENSFLKFIDYLNGKLPNTPEAGKIKYLFIVGDIISGVGNYPSQEKDLKIKDIEEQFAGLSELLGKIRKDIRIIISPGNHDGVRLMEPQPLFGERYAWSLYNLKNVLFTGNPAYLNIGAVKDFPSFSTQNSAKANGDTQSFSAQNPAKSNGDTQSFSAQNPAKSNGDTQSFSGFDVLTYHGFSFGYYANTVASLVKEKAMNSPDKIMAYLLKNRHLAPSHASTQYLPSEEDALLIKKIPDIFVSAHTHKSAVSYYNNILTISTSSWEGKTAYEEKLGSEPDFCKVPMFNLKTGAVKILDFEEEK